MPFYARKMADSCPTLQKASARQARIMPGNRVLRGSIAIYSSRQRSGILDVKELVMKPY